MTQVNIKDFLKQNVDEGENTKEVHFDRFKSPFVIKEITNAENEKLQKQATTKRKNPRNGQIERDVDQMKYAENLVATSVITPDLNDEELQRSYGTLADTSGTLKTMLKIGEYNKLAEEVQLLSGIGAESLDDEVEAVKK